MKTIFKFTLMILIILVVIFAEFMLPSAVTKKTTMIDNIYTGVISTYDADQKTEYKKEVTIHLKGQHLEKELTLMGKIKNIGKKQPFQPFDMCRVSLELDENSYDLVLWQNDSNQYTADFMMYKNEGFEDTFHITVSEDFNDLKIKGHLRDTTHIVSSIDVIASKNITIKD